MWRPIRESWLKSTTAITINNSQSLVALKPELYHIMPPLQAIITPLAPWVPRASGWAKWIYVALHTETTSINETALQFTFTLLRTKTPNYIWEQHMQDLHIFKQRNDHCRVPRHYNDNPKLGGWVTNVRSHFQFLQNGKKSSLLGTQQRLQQLQEIDFDFAPSKNNSNTKYCTAWTVGDNTCRSFTILNRRTVIAGSRNAPKRPKGLGAGSYMSVINTTSTRMVN